MRKSIICRHGILCGAGDLSIPLVFAGPQGIQVFTTYLYAASSDFTPAYGLVAARHSSCYGARDGDDRGAAMRSRARSSPSAARQPARAHFPSAAGAGSHRLHADLRQYHRSNRRVGVALDRQPVVAAGAIWDLFSWDNYGSSSLPVITGPSAMRSDIIAAGIIGTPLSR
jgi:hypothetical protein